MMNGNVPSDVSERDFPIVADDERQRSVLRFPARIPLSRLMPNGSASVRYFRTTHPLFPAFLRRIRERTNGNASVRRFRITLLLSPRIGGGYGRERTAMLPSGGSGQHFSYPRASAAGTGESEQRCSRPAVPANASPVLRASAADTGENERQCFRPAFPDNASPIPAHRRRIRERTNSNASVRHFRPTLPLLRASAAGTGESEQRCSRPAVPANASPVLRASAADTGENERQCFRPAFPDNASPIPAHRRRIRERTNSNASVRHFRPTLPLSPRIGGGYGRERTTMFPSGISG